MRAMCVNMSVCVSDGAMLTIEYTFRPSYGQIPVQRENYADKYGALDLKHMFMGIRYSYTVWLWMCLIAQHNNARNTKWAGLSKKLP